MDSAAQSANRNPQSAIGRFRTTLEMIKIEHTLFALPFAFLGATLAARGRSKRTTIQEVHLLPSVEKVRQNMRAIADDLGRWEL